MISTKSASVGFGGASVATIFWAAVSIMACSGCELAGFEPAGERSRPQRGRDLSARRGSGPRRKVLVVLVEGLSGEMTRRYLQTGRFLPRLDDPPGERPDRPGGPEEQPSLPEVPTAPGAPHPEPPSAPGRPDPPPVPGRPERPGPPGGPDRASPRPAAPSGLRHLQAGIAVRELSPPPTGAGLSSLISALTGVEVARHGVLAGSFMREGRRVSGRSEPVLAPALWRTAAATGSRVVAWDVPGLRCDGALPDTVRAVCPPPRSERSRPAADVLPIPEPGPMSARSGGWGGLIRGARLPLPSKLSRAARRSAPELTLWAAPVEREPSGEAAARLFLTGPDARLSPREVQVGQWAHGSYGSAARRSDRGRAAPPDDGREGGSPCRFHFWTRLLESDSESGRTLLYVTEASRMRTSPPELCRDLSWLSILWPPGADPGSWREGWMDPQTLGQSLHLRMEMAGRFVEWLAARSDWDLAIVRLDVPKHLAEALYLSKESPEANRGEILRLRSLLEDRLRAFDRSLGELVASVDSDTTVVLAGLGGPAPLIAQARLGGLVERIAPFSRLVASPTTAFVYLDPNERAQGKGDELKRALTALSYDGRRVFGAPGRILARVDMPEEMKRPEAGDIFLQARPGFVLSGRRAREIFKKPPVAAVVGYGPEAKASQGALFVRGPGLPGTVLGSSSIRCLAPLVLDLLGAESTVRAEPADECFPLLEAVGQAPAGRASQPKKNRPAGPSRAEPTDSTTSTWWDREVDSTILYGLGFRRARAARSRWVRS